MEHAPETLRVWDPVVRIGHWSLVAACTFAWISKEGWGHWHEWAGYATLGLVATRIAWGYAGSRYARFSQFVRSPRATLQYLRSVLARSEPRYLGHNPLGSCMALSLLAAVVLTGTTGWLYTTDEFWGVEWVERLHGWCADMLLALAVLHVAGAIFTSFRHRENLVASMIHGRKRAPADDDRV